MKLFLKGRGRANTGRRAELEEEDIIESEFSEQTGRRWGSNMQREGLIFGHM